MVINFFDKFAEMQKGFLVFILNQEKILISLMDLDEANSSYSFNLFADFSKEEASALEALMYKFKNEYSLEESKTVDVLPAEFQNMILSISDENPNFKIFKIEEMKNK